MKRPKKLINFVIKNLRKHFPLSLQKLLKIVKIVFLFSHFYKTYYSWKPIINEQKDKKLQTNIYIYIICLYMLERGTDKYTWISMVEGITYTCSSTPFLCCPFGLYITIKTNSCNYYINSTYGILIARKIINLCAL